MDVEISKHINKNNFHHAYLFEGTAAAIVPEILVSLESAGIKIVRNPDVSHIAVDTFKIEDARNLNAAGTLKAFSDSKKIFIISANSFLLEAQNVLLKLFEEPIEDTHFFVITPSVDALLPTFISRCYVIRNENLNISLTEAEQFIKLPLQKRIDFLKELLAEPDEEDETEIVVESARSKALKFLNALEIVLHKKFTSQTSQIRDKTHFFDQIFKVRQFLRQPGSSAKSLMESVALIVPIDSPRAVPN